MQMTITFDPATAVGRQILAAINTPEATAPARRRSAGRYTPNALDRRLIEFVRHQGGEARHAAMRDEMGTVYQATKRRLELAGVLTKVSHGLYRLIEDALAEDARS